MNVSNFLAISNKNTCSAIAKILEVSIYNNKKLLRLHVPKIRRLLAVLI